MNTKSFLIRASALALALAAAGSAGAQQQVPARQRDQSATLPAPGEPTATNTGTNTSSSNSNDPGLTTPTVSEIKLSRGDRLFLEGATKSGRKELQMSQALLPKLTSDRIRDYAQTLINDHKQANDELVALASRKGVALPPENDRVLAKWTGKNEDIEKDYLEEIEEDHQNAIEMYTAAQDSADPEIAAFARKTLPTLKHHLEMLPHPSVR